MFVYSLERIDSQLALFNSIKEDYLYNFSLAINNPLIGPHTLQLILTTKCNLKCRMCGVWKTSEEEVDTFYVKKSMDNAYKMGNLQQFYFTGGEVLMRPDIFSLIKYAKDYYPGVITHLNTNGLLLNKKTIDRLIDVGLTDLGISIDSPKPEIHNLLRGEGVFEKIIEAVDYINEEKKIRNVEYPRISTLSVLMEQTLDTMPDMLDFCVKYNFSGISIQPYVCNSDLRGEKADELWIKNDRLPALRDILDKIESKKGTLPLQIDIISDKIYNYFANSTYVDRCYAGFTRALVVGKKICFVCNGPNDEKYQHFGEADKDSINVVWFSEKANSFRNTIKICKNNCVQFCSIRPSSDSVTEIHQRIIQTKNLFLLFRELHLLKEYALQYPELPIKELIDADYKIIKNELNTLLTLIDNLKPGFYINETEQYLLKDLKLLDLHLEEKDGVSRFFQSRSQGLFKK